MFEGLQQLSVTVQPRQERVGGLAKVLRTLTVWLLEELRTPDRRCRVGGLGGPLSRVQL